MKKFLCGVITVLFSALLFAASPLVEDITAKPFKRNQIIVSWKLPKDNTQVTSLRIYRTTKPITKFSQLEKQNYIAQLEPETESFIDTLNDYSDYFYAVIAVTDKPYDFILYSVNSTSHGVHLVKPESLHQKENQEKKEKLYAPGTMRETPLPFLNYIEGMDGDPLISQELTDQASKLSISKNKNSDTILPYFFEEDLISPDNGDDYLLFEILKNTFVQEKYSDSIKQLKRLTGRNLSQTIINRAYFYMGEANFFIGNYEEAVKEFVKVEQVYPVLAKKWINLSLDRLYIK